MVSFFTGEKLNGNQELLWECPIEYLPVFVKAGAILPMQSVKNHTEDVKDGQINIHIYKGIGLSEQLIYEDDGKSTAYQKSSFSKTLIRMDFTANKLSIEKIAANYESEYHTANFFFHGMQLHKASLEKKGIEISHKNVAFLDEISEYDPLPDADHAFKICQNVSGFSISLEGKESRCIHLN